MGNTELTTHFKNVLKQSGRPISWASREVNVSYPHFHDVLNGRRNLSDDMREKLENLLLKMKQPQPS